MGVAAALVAMVSSVLVLDARAEEAAPGDQQHHLCGKKDLPETGLQGDVPRADQESGRAEHGYNCGLALVGHTTLERGEQDPEGYRRVPDRNANMAWARDCAYVSGPGTTFGPAQYVPEEDDPHGVAVIDVRDPTNPRHVRTLTGTAGSTQVSETLFAVDTPNRSILVVGQYGNNGSGGDKPMDVYDVTRDCADPEHVGTVVWPENIHNLTISGNGRYVFATQPLQAVDIEPLFDGDPATEAVYLGNIEAVMGYPLVSTGPFPDHDDGLPAELREARKDGYSAHQAWSTEDGTRLYLGGQLPTYEVFTIVDLTKWLQRDAAGNPGGMPEILSQRTGRGHSVSKATIGAGPGAGEWVLHAEESVFGQAYGCYPRELNPFAGPAEPYLTDVSDPTKPKMHVSRFGLEINELENCAAQQVSGVQASVHYHEFDRERNARFAILSMQNAGIRIVDVRDPAQPVEVAYFNPGDVVGGPDVGLDYAWAHSRYKDGQIWLATRAGGFWVVELEEQVRSYFGMDPGEVRPIVRPGGRAGRTGVALNATPPAVDVAPAWCTLGVVTSRT